jgi:glycosyltransferase involved in cell wall biosynthesis
MKVCAFGRALPFHGIGGLELHFQAVTRGLAQRGHDVTVITTKCPGTPPCIEDAGVRIHFLEGTLPGRYQFGYWSRSRRMFDRLGGDRAFDIVLSESSGAYGYLNGKIRGMYSLPVVLVAHGTSLRDLRTKWRHGFPTLRDMVGSLLSIMNHFRDQRFFPHLDIVVCISVNVRGSVERELGVEDARLRVVQNGVDTNMFRSDPAKRRQTRMDLDLGEHAKMVLYAGRLRREKGVHLAIRAMTEIGRSVPGAVLVVAGTGSYEGRLKRFASTLPSGGHIRFEGRIPHERLANYFNACDVYILPSLAEEGLPLTLLEVMACGKPAVSFAWGGIEAALRDGVNGYVVKRGDVGSLADGTVRILNDDALARRFGDASRERVLECFNEEQMLDGIEAVLIEAAGRPG